MTFVHSTILLLLWLVIVPGLFLIWTHRRHKQRVLRIVHQNTLKNLRNKPSDIVFNIQLALLLSSFILTIIALARPQWGQREEVVWSSGRNVLILLDVSRSMLANDVHPNRLERAKADIMDLVVDLKGDRAGIMVFRNGTSLLCPFTTDIAFLKQTLEGITIDSAPRGETDIGSAISAALTTFKELGTDHNAVILISDGEDLSGKANEYAKKAGESGIPIFCVGIGDSSGSTIPFDNALVVHKGENVITKLDNQALLDIATASGGVYISLQTAATGRTTLGALYNRHIKSIMEQELQETNETRMIERYQLFLIPAIALILIAASLSYGRPGKQKGSKLKNTNTSRSGVGIRNVVIIALGFSAVSLFADTATNTQSIAPSESISKDSFSAVSAREFARDAQNAWRQGNYDKAATLYQKALAMDVQDPKFAETLRYNTALSFLKAGNSGKAADVFKQILKISGQNSGAEEGLGVALFRAADALSAIETEEAESKPGNIALEKFKLLEEAALSFQSVLRDTPDNDERKKNLEATLAKTVELREEAKLAAIMEKYGATTPEDLAKKLFEAQRNVFASSASAFQSDSPEKIKMLETAAKSQRDAADIWMPLKQKMMEAAQSSITNLQELSDFQYALNHAAEQAVSAANALEDLDSDAMPAMKISEQTAMDLFAMLTPPPPLLAQAILAQTNALGRISDTTKVRTPAEDQLLSANLFGRFAQKLPQWLEQQNNRQMESVPADDGTTQMIPESKNISEEDLREIEVLTENTLLLHKNILQTLSNTSSGTIPEKSLPPANKALNNMLRILELLPKPPPQQQQQEQKNSEQNQEQSQQEQSQNQDKQESSENENQQPNQSESEQEQEQSEQKQEEQEAEMSEAAEDEETSADDKRTEAILEKILEQEKQREDERRKRQRMLAPRVGERDW